MVTNYVNAELIRYTSNAFLATRVSFVNTLARLYEALSRAAVDVVAYGAGLDPRIGASHFVVGSGYGDICLPKDLKALIRVCEEHGIDPLLLKTVDKVNEEQVEMVKKALGGLWGGAGAGVQSWHGRR